MVMRAEQALAGEKSAYPAVEPPCAYFGSCGGCSLQDLAYADQLALKRARLTRLLAPFGAGEVDVAGLEEPWRYRNRAELTFSESNGRMTLGYHAAKSFWRVVDLEDCLLLAEPVMRILRDVREAAAASRLPAYHPKAHHGFFRYLLVRHARATGQVLLCLITTPGSREAVERLAADVMTRHPAVASFYWGVTDRPADVAAPEELTLIAGVARLEDRVGPFRVLLGPLSFLQPASAQADRLYAAVAEAVGRVTDGTAWDLYCGLGLVSFYLARRVRKIYGIESEAGQIALAEENAALNGIANVEFRAGKVETLLRDRRFWLQQARPDAVVVDPPRAGLHPSALASLLAARPRHVAYVSCNAQSLAYDLQELVRGFPRYRLASARAFDMFPQTNHVETFAWLERV